MSDDEEVWVPLSKRKEWKEVVPIPQNDGPNPVVPIAYTSQFRELMDYFRAVVAKDERSERALELTAEVIDLNPGNYTVWHFRRLNIEALGTDLDSELEFLAHIVDDNAKNYQIWHHRRWIAEKRGKDGRDDEVEFTAMVLGEDAKNYHAWSHRQWVLKELGGWETELDFCDRLLEKDVYNNSAWNQRFFVISNHPGPAAARSSEIQYCCDAIRRAADNESAWRYLAGLFKDEKRAIARSSEAIGICIEALEKDRKCVHGLSFLLELVCQGYRPTEKLLDFVDWSEPAKLASEVCERLQTADKIRFNYWAWRRSLLSQSST